jgi:hypothetical protein
MQPLTPNKKLLVTNVICAVLQGILFMGLLTWLMTSDISGTEIRLVVGEYNGPDKCNTIAEPGLEVVVYLLLAFTFVTTCFHVFYSIGSSSYVNMVNRGNNSARWFEYSITATVMIVAISLISGVQALDSLILIACASIGTMLLGDVAEKSCISGQKSSAIVSTVVGWFLLLGAYGIIFKNFAYAANPTDPNTPKPPAFVWAIVIVMFLLFSSFGGIQVIRTMTAPLSSLRDPAYNVVTEIAYSFASMIAKTLLVLMVFSGVVGMN